MTYPQVIAAALVLTGLFVASSVAAEEQEIKVTRLAEIDARVLPSEASAQSRSMVRDDLNRRLGAVNRKSREQSLMIRSRDQWEAFSKPKLDALRKSLGDWPVPRLCAKKGSDPLEGITNIGKIYARRGSDPFFAQSPVPPEKLRTRVTAKIEGDGYHVENVLFESRPGWWVTANLYRPATTRESMPGILLCHSHHRPKEQGELQDMAMTWARAGCVVLVPDHLGHGERRQHPFASSLDYDKPFRDSRQDYYFRYDTGIQLHLVGESLMGWMAWDLMRGVDLLVSREGVDPQRIVLLGAVAGGGDPAAVTAALDTRIACAVPFNFGGPQPETRFPLPDDAETSFNYAGSGGWESTRNLRRSAVDGFLPYVIVGGIAPRRLVFAHEFNWDRERDPVWKRLTSIYSMYDAEENLAYTHGHGELKGRPPDASHCTNIGPYHRRLIHQAFKKWFDIDVTPGSEFSDRKESSQLLCMTDQARGELLPRLLIDLLPQLATKRLEAARAARADKPLAERRRLLQDQLASVLGDIDPPKPSGQTIVARETRLTLDSGVGEVSLQRVTLPAEPGITVPLLVIRRVGFGRTRSHVVIGLSQGGKANFLRQRSSEIQELVKRGYTVCLPDLRGTGETRPDDERGMYSTDTGRSSTELMLGGTTVAGRLRDLRAVMKYLRRTPPPAARSFTLWGDSFAATNPADLDFKVPRRVEERPRQSEPLGGMLALLGALYEDDVRSVYIRGGLTSFADVLQHQQVLIPHDVVVPGLLTAADMDDVAASLAPRPLVLCDLVDHLNRTVPKRKAETAYSRTLERYKTLHASDNLAVGGETESIADWLKSAQD